MGVSNNPLRIGDWMQTAGGRQYWPADPRPAEVHLDDIAAALSKQTRYGGHCLRFYSVAEHCIHIAFHLYSRGHGHAVAFAGLMHDASEAYLVDVPRPIKYRLGNYTEIEALNMAAIAERFGFAWPMPDAVKDADNRILLDEQAQNMAAPPAPWGVEGDPLGVKLRFLAPEQAEKAFLAAFAFFGGIG